MRVKVPPNHGRERRREARKPLKEAEVIGETPPYLTGTSLWEMMIRLAVTYSKSCGSLAEANFEQDQEVRHPDTAPSRTKYLWGTSILPYSPVCPWFFDQFHDRR